MGQRHFGYRYAIDLIHELRLDGEVVVLEGVSDKQLPAIYRNVKAFVYCSWAEGFGIPVLEAMASGVPAISSVTTALSEVCADAAVFVNPGRVEEITKAIRELDQKRDLRRDLALRGLRRAADFNWGASADVVRRVYLRYFGL